MKKILVSLLAISSLFTAFSAFSKDVNFICYSNSSSSSLALQMFYKSVTDELDKQQPFYDGSSGEPIIAKCTYSQYSYAKASSYVVTKNQKIIIIFIMPEKGYKTSQQMEAFYKKMIMDIRNDNPDAIICGTYFISAYSPDNPNPSDLYNAFYNAFHSFPSDKNIVSLEYNPGDGAQKLVFSLYQLYGPNGPMRRQLVFK